MTTSSSVDTSPVRLHIDSTRFGSAADACIIFEGTVDTANGAAGTEPLPISLILTGSRYSTTATLSVESHRWHAILPLTASRWGGPDLALPSGAYKVHFTSPTAPSSTPTTRGEPNSAAVDNAAIDGAAIERTVHYSADAYAIPARTLIPGVCAVTFTVASKDTGNSDTGSLTVHIAAPLSDREFGPQAQARLEAAYRNGPVTPEDAIFFESFYGHNVSCNPLGIDRAVAHLLPHVKRYWSVIDASIAVPEGAVAIVEGSEQWWRVRGAAKLLVVNDWVRKRFRRRKHQTVMQTWHGTPLKKIALSRPGLRLRPALASIRERGMWNILLAQNEHSARTIKRAYAYVGTVWQEGYPRNDVLVAGMTRAAPEAAAPATGTAHTDTAHTDTAHTDAVTAATEIRASLGIPDGVTVLLYAPTWRDDRPGHIDHLDVAAFADTLGPDYITLIRGHSRTLSPGSDIHGHRVLDVTSYPDVSRLFLVADALITDYSSVMFDFSVTGKPLYFFAPDLEHYTEQLRGFYFDLDSVAPGPLVQDPAELAALVRDRERVHAEFAPAYSAWQKRFNPRDDGNAGRRVVERLVREGILR
ncbi:MAG: CDP-glycerol glycerophosphotransferase family protein [Microbacteriaceae bacterium]